MLEAVKKVAITVVKSDAFKIGVIGIAAGVGTYIGVELAEGVKIGAKRIRESIKRVGKKGLTEEDSEKTEEVFEQKEA